MVIPTLVLVIAGKVVHQIVGFDELGGTDEFTTEKVSHYPALKTRPSVFSLCVFLPCYVGADYGPLGGGLEQLAQVLHQHKVISLSEAQQANYDSDDDDEDDREHFTLNKAPKRGNKKLTEDDYDDLSD